MNHETTKEKQNEKSIFVLSIFPAFVIKDVYAQCKGSGLLGVVSIRP